MKRVLNCGARHIRAVAGLGGCALWLAGCAFQAPPAPGIGYNIPQLPEGPSGYAGKPGWSSQSFMVVDADRKLTHLQR